jgi:hypothetical protein
MNEATAAAPKPELKRISKPQTAAKPAPVRTLPVIVSDANLERIKQYAIYRGLFGKEAMEAALTMAVQAALEDFFAQDPGFLEFARRKA